MDENGKRVRHAWNNRDIPIILRRRHGKLRLRVPFKSIDPLWVGRTGAWLHASGKHHPEWHNQGRYWEVPQSWFNNLVDRLLRTYGKLHIIQPHREQEKCARRCKEAKGHICECSCLGKHHGEENMSGWLEITETFATRWGEEETACRLMILKPLG